jgi:hypothetical protein
MNWRIAKSPYFEAFFKRSKINQKTPPAKLTDSGKERGRAGLSKADDPDRDKIYDDLTLVVLKQK